MKRTVVAASRILVLAAALSGALPIAVSADEITEVYRVIYEEAEGLSQKYAAIVNLVSLQDRSTAPILAIALEEFILTQKSYSLPSELETYARAIRVIVQALGDYKYSLAAPFLWDAVQQVPDPLAKSEALIALGKLRALAYAERIALYLRDLNFSPTQDIDSGEKRAYGAIIALEKLKDPRGFSPVFFASDGWYSLRVRQQAERSLPNIVDDPSDAITDIIRVESPDRKVKALKAEMASKAPGARKTEIAALALDLGHEKIGRDKAEAKTYADLRKYALRSLIAYKAKDEASVPGCKASYEDGFDDEERLLGLAALGSNGSDPAASELRDMILKFNSDQKYGLSDENMIRMAKAAIENAALTKNKIVKVALMSVVNNDKWSGSVILAAQRALKEIP